MTTQTGTTYQLEGRMLEVCSCGVLCPCWVGADPDWGTCDAAVGWHIDSGTIQGVDVSGLTVALSAHIPGNVLKGNWQALIYVDDQATQEQQDALLSVFTGKLGGPIADLAALIGEVVGVERAPITFTVEGGERESHHRSEGPGRVSAFHRTNGGVNHPSRERLFDHSWLPRLCE